MTPEVETRLEQQELRIEKNKLIMKFMEVEPNRVMDSYYSWADQPFFYTNSPDKEKILRDIANYMKYDTSYDFIMPVAEKCMETDVTDSDEYYANISYAVLSFDVKKIYNACYEFIQHHYAGLDYRSVLIQDEQRYEDAKI